MSVTLSKSLTTFWKCCFLIMGITILGAPFALSQVNHPKNDPCLNQDPQTIINGVKDQFSAPEEATYQGTGIQSLGSGPWAPFDYRKADRQFGHTMQNLPCSMVRATLTLSLKSNSALSRNDTIGLGVTGGNPRFLWARRIKDVLGVPWDQPGQTQTMVLELGALPLANGGTVSILDLVNAKGELDIYMQDDTAVDFVQLQAYPCVKTDCNNNGVDDACEANPLTIRCPPPIEKLLPSRVGQCCLEFQLTPFASDLCGNQEGIVITNDYNGATGAFSDCFPVGTTTIVFTATDPRGNQVSCTTTVTVIDDTPPTILFCPEP